MESLFKGRPWQREFLEVALPITRSSSGEVLVVLARRQTHKSATNLILLLTCLQERSNATYGYFAPTYRQCERQFLELQRWSRECGIPLRFNGGDLSVTHSVTHSVIKMFSLNREDNVRSETLHGAVIDEAAFCSDAGISLVFPMLDVHRGWCVLASTPWLRKGMFYQLYNDASSLVFDWTRWSPEYTLGSERLAFYRRTLSPALFQTEIMGQFLDDGESVLYGNIRQYIECVPYSNEPLIVGIDASVGKSDYCSLVSFFLRDGVYCEYESIRFRNDDAESNVVIWARWLESHPNIRVIAFETNSIGKPLMQSLRKRLVDDGFAQIASKVREDYWTGKSKGEAVANSVLLFNMGRVRLHTDKVIDEACAYTQFISKGGVITFGNAHQSDSDYHDDMWCAALHALSAKVSAGSYNIV